MVKFFSKDNGNIYMLVDSVEYNLSDQDTCSRLEISGIVVKNQLPSPFCILVAKLAGTIASTVAILNSAARAANLEGYVIKHDIILGGPGVVNEEIVYLDNLDKFEERVVEITKRYINRVQPAL